MSHEKLTGLTRHRSEIKWGKKRLILQVQERGLVTTNIAGLIDTDWMVWWRDAKTTDLTEMKLPTAEQP